MISKEETKKYYKEYYEKNKETIKQRQKEYNRQNRENRLTKQKEWRDANREKIHKQQKEYRNIEENKKKRKLYNKEYNKKYSLKLKDNDKERYKTNKMLRDNTIDGITMNLFNHAKTRSKKHNYELDFDKLFLTNLIKEAFHKLGEMISVNRNSPIRASMDQIIPGKGYTADNIQIIPQWLNYAYHDFDKNLINDEIIKFAEYLKSMKK
jgi:hypothetical protein